MREGCRYLRGRTVVGEALPAVKMCSLKVAKRLSRLYITLRVHFTPARLFRMGVRLDSNCPRCLRDHGDLIHLLWRCPKLHLFWTGVLSTISRVFHVTIPTDPKPCVLWLVDDIPMDDNPKQAIARALFQARKLDIGRWLTLQR